MIPSSPPDAEPDPAPRDQDFDQVMPRELAEELVAAARARRSALSAEVAEAGFWARREHPSAAASLPGSPSGFGSGEVLDTLAPGPPLAAMADGVTAGSGLSGLDDDELIGVLRAWQRLESWSSAGLLSVAAELARRRPAGRTPAAAKGTFPAQLSEFISDELAAALRLTGRSGSECVDLALDLAQRLPGTARAHHEGRITRLKARIIADAVRILDDEQARSVEDRVLPAAEHQTSGQLRAAVARAVLAIDPEAATRRREQAEQDPRVRRWREDAGTAALAGYGLPPADVLEADQRLTDRALSLRSSGLTGTLDELRARAYLDTLLGRDRTRPAPPGIAPDPVPPSPASSCAPDPASQPTAGRVASMVTLTASLTTMLGLADDPGEVAGFGPVDPALTRQLGRLAAAHPATRWCLTVTDDHGQPIGHGCGPGQPRISQRPVGPADFRPFTVTVRPLASSDHENNEPGYVPSRRLQHLIRARTPTCSAPGCRWPAWRCDLDHTVPFDGGGCTCDCNLAPLCRRHHRCKQAAGWRLEQPEPGTMLWTTPAGRRYLTEPESYPER